MADKVLIDCSCCNVVNERRRASGPPRTTNPHYDSHKEVVKSQTDIVEQSTMSSNRSTSNSTATTISKNYATFRDLEHEGFREPAQQPFMGHYQGHLPSDRASAPPQTLYTSIHDESDLGSHGIIRRNNLSSSDLDLEEYQKHRNRRFSDRAAVPKVAQYFDGSTRARKVATQPTTRPVVNYTLFDFSTKHIEQKTGTDIDEIEDLTKLPDWASVRWLNVEGLDRHTIQKISEEFKIHPLSQEDIFLIPQRPRLDKFKNYLFVISTMVTKHDNVLVLEQVSFFLYKNVLITIQEGLPGDVWDPVRTHLTKSKSRIRKRDASYLLYCLLDVIINSCFPIVRHIGNRLEQIEARMMEKPTAFLNKKIYELTRELMVMKHHIEPMQDVIDQLIHVDEMLTSGIILWTDEEGEDEDEDDEDEEYEEALQQQQLSQSGGAVPTPRFTKVPTLMPRRTEFVSPVTKRYLSDVKNNTVQLHHMIATYFEMCTSLDGFYSDHQGQRMNQVMYILTMVSSIFIPLTFIAGVYGMNFKYMPELDWRYGYFACWGTMAAIVAIELLVMWKKNLFKQV